MLERLGPGAPNAAREYLRLAQRVASFLSQRGCQGWGQLDVEAFVSSRAEDTGKAIEVCCNLSSILPYLIESGELSVQDATALWVSLLEVCPEDDPAEAYILQGLEEHGDLGQLEVEALGRRVS